MMMLRIAGALGAALMMVSPMVASAADLGIYQTTDRKMDFRLSTCGSDDKALCVKLEKARGSSATWQVKPHIGKLVVNKAKPSGKNAWKGVMQFGQYELNGTMTLKPGKSFKVSGCAYVVICEDINLVAAK